jgi:hypothetical protein
VVPSIGVTVATKSSAFALGLTTGIPAAGVRRRGTMGAGPGRIAPAGGGAVPMIVEVPSFGTRDVGARFVPAPDGGGDEGDPLGSEGGRRLGSGGTLCVREALVGGGGVLRAGSGAIGGWLLAAGGATPIVVCPRRFRASARAFPSGVCSGLRGDDCVVVSAEGCFSAGSAGATLSGVSPETVLVDFPLPWSESLTASSI